MNLEDIWLAHLRDIVDKEARSGGSLRSGYRSVASKMAKSEEYIYQLYQGKPKASGAPRVVTLDFAKALARHYAEGRDHNWINLPIVSGNATQQPGSEKQDAARATVAPIATWPFKQVSYRRFMALPREAQREIDEYLDSMVMTWERKLTQKPGADRKRR